MAETEERSLDDFFAKRDKKKRKEKSSRSAAAAAASSASNAGSNAAGAAAGTPRPTEGGGSGAAAASSAASGSSAKAVSKVRAGRPRVPAGRGRRRRPAMRRSEPCGAGGAPGTAPGPPGGRCRCFCCCWRGWGSLCRESRPWGRREIWASSSSAAAARPGTPSQFSGCCGRNRRFASGATRGCAAWHVDLGDKIPPESSELCASLPGKVWLPIIFQIFFSFGSVLQ